MEETANICKCGCGMKVKTIGSTYLRGHYIRTKDTKERNAIAFLGKTYKEISGIEKTKKRKEKFERTNSTVETKTKRSNSMSKIWTVPDMRVKYCKALKIAQNNFDVKRRRNNAIKCAMSNLNWKMKQSEKTKIGMLKNNASEKISKKRKIFIRLNPHQINSRKRFLYGNILFRSTWEVEYAKFFDENNIKWIYEPKLFEMQGISYIPDFYFPEHKKWLEVKGWRDNGKFELFVKSFPEISALKILGKSVNDKINVLDFIKERE